MRIAPPRLASASGVVFGSILVAAPLLVVLPASGAVDPSSGGSATSLGSRLPSTRSVALGTPAAAEVVTPQVREVSVAQVAPSKTERRSGRRLAARSAPQPVHGFGMVGATWLGPAPAGLRLDVRTQTETGWSAWRVLDGGHGGHGPNPDSAEAEQARVGTDALGVGEVDAVQLRATSASGVAPRDLELSVVDPGESVLDEEPVAVSASKVAPRAADEAPGMRAPRPSIRSRASWGADGRMRTGSAEYGKVKVGFVHHTVNTNDYSRSDVPAIIRGIYAYHTQSLGWSDIGYNFLVDRFGREWTGRFGGKRRAVIGAQVYGYNHRSTGIAAIGNFETRRPPREMRKGIGRVLGWKLGLHDVRVGGRYRWMEGERFRAVSGHRDGGQTACPGIKLYRRLDDIRGIAERRQDR